MLSLVSNDMNDKPLYPNQQLQSVSACTFFSGRISAHTKLADVQREYAERLPRLFVPHAVPGQAPSLQPYQLRSTEGGADESLAIALNQATYISFNYPGHTAFKENATALLGRSYELLDIDELLRVEYRYENLIAVERVNGVLSLDRVLVSLLPEGCISGLGLVGFKSEWTTKWDKGVQSIAAGIEDADGVDVLRLVVSATCDPAGGVEGLDGFIASAHSQARDCFEAIITDEFREVLRGSGGEGEQ